MLDSKRRQSEDELKILELQARLKAKITERDKEENDSAIDGGELSIADTEIDTSDSLVLLSSKLSEKEAKLIGKYLQWKNSMVCYNFVFLIDSTKVTGACDVIVVVCVRKQLIIDNPYLS